MVWRWFERKRLDLLVVVSRRPGHGHFRRFIDDCKAAYDVIGVWEIHNPALSSMLVRWGFVEKLERIEPDPLCWMMRWTRT